MSGAQLVETRRRFHDDVQRLGEGGYHAPPGAPPPDVAEQAAFWRGLYEAERVRLAKLWILHRDLEDEVADLRTRASAAGSATGAPARRTRRTRAVGYRYGAYRLYRAPVTLANGQKRTIRFFAKKRPERGTPTPIPPGFTVIVTRSGLPVLRRIRAASATPTRAPAPRPTRQRPPARASTRSRGPTPAQRRALAYARDMKALRRRAKRAPGGTGRIADRSSARRLRAKYGLRRP